MLVFRSGFATDIFDFSLLQNFFLGEFTCYGILCYCSLSFMIVEIKIVYFFSLYFECSGIGIVNAIEVVNAFPADDGLHKFREWIESPDPTILKKFDAETGSSSKKRGPKVSDGLNCSKSNINDVSALDQNISQAQEQKQSVIDMQDIKQIFMDKHVFVKFPAFYYLWKNCNFSIFFNILYSLILKQRNVSKNWHIPSSFPSEAVITAYSSPQVDKSTEPFTWGKPDHFVLRK